MNSKLRSEQLKQFSDTIKMWMAFYEIWKEQVVERPVWNLVLGFINLLFFFILSR